MKLIANDTLHVSSVGPDNIAPHGEFEVSDDVGQNLIERGLARKAAASHSDKMAPAPANKAEPKRRAK